jgi:SnoaL-like domain
MYDDDAVLEFPQSGERFEGVANIREWRSRYPGSVSFDIRRIRGVDDIWVAEMTVSYGGGEPRYGVDVLEIRNGKIVRETVYVGEPFDTCVGRRHRRRRGETVKVQIRPVGGSTGSRPRSGRASGSTASCSPKDSTSPAATPVGSACPGRR